MAVARQSAFSHLLAPGLRHVLFNKFGQLPTEYDKLFNVETSQRQYEEDSEIMGMGAWSEKEEGTSVGYDNPYQAYELARYTHVPYAKGFRVTHEMYINDLYKIMNRMSESLARGAHQTIEVQAANTFNNSFSTAYPGIDGASLCSTAHPNIARHAGSGPYSNRPATDADISQTVLQDAIDAFETMTDDADLNIGLRANLLVISPANKWIAKELLDSELKPYVGDNEINALKGEGLSYFTGHYFTDTDAWWLMSEKSQHSLYFYWREKLSFDNDDDFMELNYN